MSVMSSKNQLKIDIITKLDRGEITAKQAQLLLDKAPRTIERYLQQMRLKGARFIFHGNKGKTPANKLSKDIEKSVKDLIKKKYYDFNISHMRERLLEDDALDIKRETLRQWAKQIHMRKRVQRRPPKARQKRQRMSQKGLMLQMDGSTHNWFGGMTSCLIAAIDDADSEMTAAEFFHGEDTLSCMTLIRRIIERHGRFHVLYVDRAGLYGGPKRVEFAQLKRALEELGIQVIYANSPQAKGRIERAFNTLQDRLIPELRLAGITTFPAANRYLQEHFIPKTWNKKFALCERAQELAYRPLEEAQLAGLNEIFCIKEHRKINNDHTISYKGDLYQVTPFSSASLAKRTIEIRTYCDLTQKFFFGNVELEVKKICKTSYAKAV